MKNNPICVKIVLINGEANIVLPPEVIIEQGGVFMTTSKNKMVIPLLALVTYLVMILLNALANIIPINGRGTGEISDAYGNLFAPAAVTFAIWGLIYILLLIYLIQRLLRLNTMNEKQLNFWNRIDLLFIISSIANSLWILAWHYDFIGFSLILMVIILLCLIGINWMLRKEDMTIGEKLMSRVPFNVYFGWITVASIANVVTYLVYIGWERFGLSEVFWMDIILIVGAGIGFGAILFYRSYSYGLVLIWAYGGIGLKHLSPQAFNGQYTSVVITVFVSLLVLFAGEIIMFRTRKRLIKMNSKD